MRDYGAGDRTGFRQRWILVHHRPMSSAREARALNLLLLLSALLSAMTGIGAARGQAAPASAVCACTAQARAANRAVRSIAHRPAATFASIVASTVAPLAVVPDVAASEPLFASRRRE